MTKPALPGSTVSITHSGPSDKKTLRNSYHCSIYYINLDYLEVEYRYLKNSNIIPWVEKPC